MVLSHCLKTDFYDSLTVGLNPKPLVIFTVFSFLTKQHKLTQQPHLQISVSVLGSGGSFFFFFFFGRIGQEKKKISVFALGIDRLSSKMFKLTQKPSLTVTSKQRHVAYLHPVLGKRVVEGGRMRILTQQSWKHQLQHEHNYLAFPPLLFLFFFLLILLVLSMLF